MSEKIERPDPAVPAIQAQAYQPNMNALCVSIVLNLPPPPPGLTMLIRKGDEWPAWMRPWVAQVNTSVVPAGPDAKRRTALKLNEVPIKVTIANCPTAAQLMLLLERVLLLKGKVQARTTDMWVEIAREVLARLKLGAEPHILAIEACDELLSRITGTGIIPASN